MKRTAACLAIASFALLAACNKAGKTGQPNIAVIPKGTTHLYWKSVKAGAEKAAREFGVNLTFVGPQREDDRSQQIDLVTNQALQNDAIVLAPLDSVALRDSAKAVADGGKPVIIIDSALKDSAGFVTSFVATDNHAAGAMAARRIVELLADKGKVAMLRYMQGSASTEDREAGFLEEIAKHPGIEVTSSEQFSGATASQAQDVATNLLTRLASGDGLAVDAIFTSNQTNTYGMLQALRGKNLAGKVKFVGFDCDATFIDALKKGEMQGIVLQDPSKMGYLAVKAAYEKLKGQKVAAVIDTGATLATPENLGEPDVAALVATQLP